MCEEAVMLGSQVLGMPVEGAEGRLLCLRFVS